MFGTLCILLCSINLTNLSASVVQILIIHPEREKPIRGTGWITKIERDHVYIITAGHVIEDWRSNSSLLFMSTHRVPRYYSGGEILYKSVNNENFHEDVAVLRFQVEDPTQFRKLQVEDTYPLKEGEMILTYGWSGEDPYPCAIIAVLRVVMRDTFIFYPRGCMGRSGSPILNERGRVVGMLMAKSPHEDGLAVKIGAIRDNLPHQNKAEKK